MDVQTYTIAPHNAHYEGAYSSTELEWRRLGAVDKVNNLQNILGDLSVKTVLEVGCGTGALLAEVVRRGG